MKPLDEIRTRLVEGYGETWADYDDMILMNPHEVDRLLKALEKCREQRDALLLRDWADHKAAYAQARRKADAELSRILGGE